MNDKSIEALRMFDTGWDVYSISEALEVSQGLVEQAITSEEVRDSLLAQRNTLLSACGGLSDDFRAVA